MNKIPLYELKSDEIALKKVENTLANKLFCKKLQRIRSKKQSRTDNVYE